MPPRPRPLPAELGSVFAVAEAAAVGVSNGRLRASDLEIPFRGVRRRAPSHAPSSIDAGAEHPSPDDVARTEVRARADEYASIMRPHAFFAGRTAAVLLGLPVRHHDRLVVGVLAPDRAPRRRGIHGIQLRPHLVSVGEVEGLRVSSPASTWATLGAELTVRELVIVGDALIRVPRDQRGARQPQRRLATLDQLARAVAAGPRRGTPLLGKALTLIREGSSSPLETDFRLLAGRAGLPEAELDVEIRDRAGRLLGITEFAYPAQRVLVEVEGDHHRTDRAQWARDLEKYAAYAEIGWEVVRLAATHIRGREARAVAIVRATLARRGVEHGSAP